MSRLAAKQDQSSLPSLVLNNDIYHLKIPFWTSQQEEGFVRSYDKALFAIFMEPRTGKSKIVIDTACYHYERPLSPLHINGLLIIAWPAGVHRGWITDAAPENIPDRIPWKGFVWRSNKADRKWYAEEFNELLDFEGLPILAINAEALQSEITRKAIGRFLKRRKRVMAVADESSFMATPGIKRSRVMNNLGKLPQIIIKRILDGTPVAQEGPFDYYSQVGFLSKSILGFTSAVEFRNHFAVMEVQGDWVHRDAVKKAVERIRKEGRITDPMEIAAAAEQAVARVGKTWPAIKKDENGAPIFKNMDELWTKLKPISYRATFAECFNTPRKVYQKRYFELSDQQRKVYDSLRDQYKTEIEGEEITVAHALSRLLRLQQIASNYYPEQKGIKNCPTCDGIGCEACDDLGVVETVKPLKIIDHKHNPRLEALREELKPGRPTIVWARFRQDAASCFELAQSMGLSPVRYDGDMKDKAKDDFQAGRANVFVANPQAAGRGIPLWKAAGHVYYSNMFSYRTRQQSEDRAEIAHRTIGTSIVDLIASDTVDDQVIVPALRSALNIATYIMKDKAKEWL